MAVEQKNTPDSDERGKMKLLVIGIREKLILIFLVVKVVPLILLAFIAWRALVMLGDNLRETSVKDTREALTALAASNIERVSTDTAQKIAEFLYARDTDVTFLAKAIGHHDFNKESDIARLTNFFHDYSTLKTGLVRKHGEWELAADGMSWIQKNPYKPPEETKKRSVNKENEDTVDGVTFHYRPPYGFGDTRSNFVSVPLYDEIAVIDKNGKQVLKYITPDTTKKRYRFPQELVDVSKSENTFVKAEYYFDEIKKIAAKDKNGIYVSDVIGAYVPCHFVGMYTPDYMASKLIDAKVAELEKTVSGLFKNTQHIAALNDLIWKLQVLNAELKNEQDKFNSETVRNRKIRDEIDKRLGKGKIWKIKDKNFMEVADDIGKLINERAEAENTLSRSLKELADKIRQVEDNWHPESEGYAGAENPLGIRFEGIVRWAKPILDNKTGEINGYVTFALNHDHLLDMIAHVTPLPQRYSELSDAFNGNYTFIWDYNCRSIVHPRHHSIVGFNPNTGKPETPWLEKTLYDGMIKAGIKREDWQDYIATLKDYVPFPPFDGSEEGMKKADVQSRKKKPAPELTKEGLVGLDGRYLNNAPQCTGWMDLAKDGGSGSLYILWSGVYKLNTASAIPYYTGQYAPENRNDSRIGFGFIAVGCGIDDFSKPADTMDQRLSVMVDGNLAETTWKLIITTVILSVLVIFIAVWMASYLSNRLQWLISGISKFRSGERYFRFATTRRDEFGRLADSFDEMAENIVRSVHTPQVILDGDMKIIYANRPCLTILDKTLDEVIGKLYSETSIYSYGTEYCPITALLKHGHNKALVMFDKKTQRYWQGEANYFTDEYGQKIGYIVTSNDVNDLQKQQIELEKAKTEAEIANKHKSNFLARMSHELRTPMNAIIGMNNLAYRDVCRLSDREEYIELEKHLDVIRNSSEVLLNLLNDILDISSLENGSIQLSRQPLNLREMLDNIADSVRLSCNNKHLNFKTQFQKFEPVNFVVDGLRLRQVLNNLFSNAMKFTPESGTIEFAVSRKDRKGGKSLLSFSIKDTGIGISQNDLEKIFYPFEQLDTAKIQQHGGNGLGLPIAQQLLKFAGSEIHVESEPGKGSEFRFDIWLTELETEQENKLVDVTDKFKGQRALVIDDVAINRMVLVSLLKVAGFATDEAKDGMEGLTKFENSAENYYDVVFMDLSMPVMDGFESTRAIRSLERADSQKVPIIAISANAFKEDIEKSLDSGMNSHYPKPIKMDSLSKILMRYCKPTE
ncbi:MAG: response regulator [Planctomycetaceae bacterium]|jgi:signal transduction histidine kinase/CheY-like chemotaxis protein/methyl-accepting chemotaxis protein|nr:response regulator [Planctomycetaceae bacterium]